MSDEYSLKLKKLKLLQDKKLLRDNLPHIYGFPFYPWSGKFFRSTNKTAIVCAANQISKSSTGIRQCIEWATNTKLWPTLWPHRQPLQFWYLYPSSYVASIEFEKKWTPEFMPREPLKNHPLYGWRADYRSKYIQAVHFNSGVSIYFKTYSQDVQDLQSGSVDACWCFAAGTKVVTSCGEKNIEDIVAGDFVLSHLGWNRVSSTIIREADTVTRTINNKTITATPDHLFWTENSGWVQFGNLTNGDICLTVPECGLKKKLFYLTVKYLLANHLVKMRAGEIISKLGLGIITTLDYGSVLIIREFQKIASFIIKTLTHSTIELKTCNYSPEQSTQRFTNGRNGSCVENTNLSALPAESLLKLEALKTWLKGFVLFPAVENRITGRISVLSAMRSLWLGKILDRNSVLSSAPTDHKRQTVYDIKVENSKAFLANGFLVHNCDEEIPEELVPELQARTFATDGYMRFMFTPTLGQEYWREAVESNKRFPDALKLQVSMYDCMTYEDGTPSPWTTDRIQKIINSCKSEAEVQRRVYGKFVLDSGLKYQAFSPANNLIEPINIPDNYLYYIGVDSGSGGKFNHPSAYCIVAMRPDFQLGYVVAGRRFDGIPTTNSDLVAMVRDRCREMNITPTQIFYDYAATDLATIAHQMGETWYPAEKSHLIGEQFINVGFKNKMLQIFNIEELSPLVSELKSLKLSTPKNQAHDDYCDALRYCITRVPWDWSCISDKPITTPERKLTESEERRKFFMEEPKEELDIEGEMLYWDNLLEDYGYEV